jgi:hypothetical protein
MFVGVAVTFSVSTWFDYIRWLTNYIDY